MAGWVVASDNFLNLETLAVVGETALKFLVFPVCAGVRCMVDIMYLSGVRARVQVGLVSALPDLYVKKLGMVPLAGARQALAHVLKSRGARQKVLVVTDGSRVLMR